jgi:hypothetical protein
LLKTYLISTFKVYEFTYTFPDLRAGKQTMKDGLRLGMLIALSAAGAAGHTDAVGEESPPGTGGIMLPSPDTEAAVWSEFARAKAKKTRAALERFIRRHPGHPLVDDARKALDDMDPA